MLQKNIKIENTLQDLENLSDFSRRFKSLLKFIKDSNVESGLGFLVLSMLGIGC
jgi:hypothetical protein